MTRLRLADVSRSPHALAALSGVLLALSFPKFGRGGIAFAALVPLLVAIGRERGRHAARLGYLSGAVWSLGTLYWTSDVVRQFGGLGPVTGAAATALLCLAVGLFPLLFGWGLGRLVVVAGPVALLATPVVWVATEILRAHTFFRFPWCLLGYTQHAHLPLLQLASLAGVYGLSFLVSGVSGVLAYVLLEQRPAARHRAIAVGAAALALSWTHGYLRLSSPPADSGETLRVGLVQPSIAQEQKWDPQQALSNFQAHVDLTHEAARDGARLIVWPESSLPGLMDRSPGLARQMRELARELGVFLVFGNDDLDERPDGRRVLYVGAKMLEPGGELTLRYHKMRLVPFGEYVPLKPLFTLGGRFAGRLVQQVADFEPGAAPVVARVDSGSLAASICYEAIFPDLARASVAAGAELLVNVTNDGWYGRSSAPYQHFAMARLRAVETGRYLARAANTGISAVVDPRGRVVIASSLFERRTVVADVSFEREITPYVRYGDVLPWACLIATLLAAATSGRFGGAARTE